MRPSLQDAVRLVHSKDPNNKQFGTGFAIHKVASTVYFLTCMHVVTAVGGDDQVMVGGCPAQLVACGSDDLVDLAVLQVDGRSDVPALQLDTGGETGDRFIAIGFREYGVNYLLTPIEGTLGRQCRFVSTTQAGPIESWHLEIETGDALRRGYSGAPVVSRDGKVLGIINYREGTQRGLAISTEALREIWPERPPGIIYTGIKRPTKPPRKKPETLSDRIDREEYWGLLQQATIQAVAAGGMAAVSFYRQTETLATLPWPAILGHDQKERNPSTIADLQATAAVLQSIDVYLSPITHRLGCALSYLGEETRFHEWLEKNLRDEVFDKVKSPREFFTNQNNIIRVILDAIDGTANFVRGIPLFCSGAAILVDQNVRVSAIYDPIHHVVYSGVLKGPDDNPEARAEAWTLQVATGNKINLVELASQAEHQALEEEGLGVHLTRSDSDKLRSFASAQSPGEASQLETLASTCRGIYAFNSGLVALADVARGALGGFVNNTTNLWDVAAGEVLVRACKGKVTDFDGASIDYSSKTRTSVVAARNHSLHARILDIVGK